MQYEKITKLEKDFDDDPAYAVHSYFRLSDGRQVAVVVGTEGRNFRVELELSGEEDSLRFYRDEQCAVAAVEKLLEAAE